MRSNVEKKLEEKHNVNWRVARATTQYPSKNESDSGTSWVYFTPVSLVECKGFLFWRSCEVKETVTVKAVADFHRNTSDGRPKGFITTYCLAGEEKCPDYVKNAVNLP